MVRREERDTEARKKGTKDGVCGVEEEGVKRHIKEKEYIEKKNQKGGEERETQKQGRKTQRMEDVVSRREGGRE